MISNTGISLPLNHLTIHILQTCVQVNKMKHIRTLLESALILETKQTSNYYTATGFKMSAIA